jgi:hypothetical protein
MVFVSVDVSDAHAVEKGLMAAVVFVNAFGGGGNGVKGGVEVFDEVVLTWLRWGWRRC